MSYDSSMICTLMRIASLIVPRVTNRCTTFSTDCQHGVFLTLPTLTMAVLSKLTILVLIVASRWRSKMGFRSIRKTSLIIRYISAGIGLTCLNSVKSFSSSLAMGISTDTSSQRYKRADLDIVGSPFHIPFVWVDGIPATIS